MSLLVLDPDTAAGESLTQQLTDLGFEAHLCADAGAALEVCAKGRTELLICGDLTVLPEVGNANLPPATGLILATSEISVEDVLGCLAEGVDDVWLLPLSGEQLRKRAENVVSRMKRWLAEVSSELRDMRAELERDQRAGQYIQMGMLPPNPMGVAHFKLQHRVEPSLILSGDFVDYFQITDRHFACYVADVAGHGASSAFVTVLLKNFSRRLRREYRLSMLDDPGEVLNWINTELIEQQIDKHVAMFFGLIDVRDQKLAFANAAQFPPAALVSGESLQILEQKGKPLGLFPDNTWSSEVVEFPVGSRLIAFSDGVLDLLEGPGLQQKEEELNNILISNQSMDDIWSCLDTTRLGVDDVSCLYVHHEA